MKRIDQDRCRDGNSGIYVQTRSCCRQPPGLGAVLECEPCSFDDELICSDGSRYQVVKVFG